MQSHEIDYKILGSELQIVEIELDPKESVIAEAGSLNYMDSNIHMEAIFGDASYKSEHAGLFEKFLGAGKRLLSGESFFMTLFTNHGISKHIVAFAAPYPGTIIPVDLTQIGHSLICQKESFLCAAKGVSVGIAFSHKLGFGFFGGEGFILQKLEGDGYAFLHAGGYVSKKELQSGETLVVDTGCLVAMTKTIRYDIQLVRGIKSMFFGGEGIFNTTLTGPGIVWLQSLPFSRLSARILSPLYKHKGSGGSLSKLFESD